MAKHRPVPRVDALQLSAAPVGDVLLTTSRVGPSNSQTAMFPRKRPSRKARKSLAEARNVMIERGRNISGLDPAHADASDSESLAEVCIEKTTRSRNDSDLGRNSAITTESLSVCTGSRHSRVLIFASVIAIEELEAS